MQTDVYKRQELKQCKNELEKLNRKKSILYRKKCDKLAPCIPGLF